MQKLCHSLFDYERTLVYIIAYIYSHLSNKRGGGAKIAKSINMEVGINVEGGILWKKLMHNSNKRGVDGGKNLRNQYTWRVNYFLRRVEFFKIGKRGLHVYLRDESSHVY